MISYIKESRTNEELFEVLHPVVRKWFKSKFKTFSEPQKYALMNIHNKKNTLVSAVTGSGKTLTAFLTILNELITLEENNALENKIYAVYISPLKALNSDIHFNLLEPLREIEELLGRKLKINVQVRTGDTSPSERQKMLRKVPHIFITTPESLGIVLTSPKFKENLKNVQWLIVDELHALADSKRGVDLSLSLERLDNYCNEKIIRIGLSATAEPLEDIAQFLVGSKRDCDIAKIDLNKKMDLKVLSPVPDLINTTYEESNLALYNLLDNLIQEHKTTLIFTNTRAATERVVHHLKERFPKRYTENIGAHHGSLSKELRLNIEKKLRNGELKCIVCSTSLELGIDIGYVDLVILLGSPKSVARASQRCGRAGHALHDTIKGRIVVLDRDDLVECSVLLKNVLERNIDRIHIPRNCLDVLSQQIYGIAISERVHVEDLWKLVTGSFCYKDLIREDFMEVIKYLSGGYNSLEDRWVFAKIWYDEDTGMIGKKGKLARVMYMTNIGTIPDETFVSVKAGDQVIGHIDEGFLERLKRGDVFVLGGQKYEFLYGRGMTAQVNTSVYRSPTIPSWFSEMLPLNFDLAMEIGKLRRLLQQHFESGNSKKEIIHFLNNYLYLDENAANAIYQYFKEQYLFAEIPNDKKLLVEYYQEENKHFVVFHSLYGRRVNDVLSRAVAYIVGRLQKRDVEIGISDNGFYLSSDQPIQAIRAFKFIKCEELNEIMDMAIERTEVLKRRFRHCAARSLMILRSYKGRKKRVGRQQVSSMILMKAVKRISEDFCILKEAKREVLEDLMDIDNAKKVLEDVETGKVVTAEISTRIPSPFAFDLVLQGYVDVMKIEDKVEFLRRMHAMVLAKIGKEHEI